MLSWKACVKWPCGLIKSRCRAQAFNVRLQNCLIKVENALWDRISIINQSISEPNMFFQFKSANGISQILCFVFPVILASSLPKHFWGFKYLMRFYEIWKMWFRFQSYEKFYFFNLLLFIISKNVCPWHAFPA